MYRISQQNKSLLSTEDTNTFIFSISMRQLSITFLWYLLKLAIDESPGLLRVAINGSLLSAEYRNTWFVVIFW